MKRLSQLACIHLEDGRHEEINPNNAKLRIGKKEPNQGKGAPSPFTMAALDQKVLFHIWGMTDRAGHQAGTGPAVCVTVLPFTVEARGGGPTLHTRHTPGGSRKIDPQHLSYPRQPEVPSLRTL